MLGKNPEHFEGQEVADHSGKLILPCFCFMKVSV